MKDLDNVKRIYSTCLSLQATTSRKEKESILYNNIDDKEFKDFIYHLLNPFFNTGISYKKLNKDIDLNKFEYMPQINSLNDLYRYLYGNNTGRDIDILAIQNYINSFDNEIIEFLTAFITKTLKLGVDSKTINKIWINNKIPTFNVMLGTSIEHAKLPNNIEFSISQKLNGSRCVYYNHKLYTRQGKEYTGLNHIIKDIRYLISLQVIPNNVVLDGELILNNKSDLSDSEAFQVSVGIANSKLDNKDSLKLVIFDILSESEFTEGYSTNTYFLRKKKLLHLKEYIAKHNNINNLDIVKFFYQGYDQNRIWQYLEYAEQNDMEGIMINLNAPYECKRTKNMLKVKKFYTYDLSIVDLEEGQGKLKNMLGAFLVKFKNNIVKVGTGISEEQRKEFWSNKENLIGKIIEVKYKEETKDKKTGLPSLQFPVFVSLREDKNEPSYE